MRILNFTNKLYKFYIPTILKRKYEKEYFLLILFGLIVLNLLLSLFVILNFLDNSNINIKYQKE